MSAKLIVAILSQYTHISNHCVVTQNLYSVTCQLYLNKTEGWGIKLHCAVEYCLITSVINIRRACEAQIASFLLQSLAIFLLVNVIGQ